MATEIRRLAAEQDRPLAAMARRLIVAGLAALAPSEPARQ